MGGGGLKGLLLRRHEGDAGGGAGRGRGGWAGPAPLTDGSRGGSRTAGRRQDQALPSEGQGLRTQGAEGSLSVAKSKLRVIKRCPPPSRGPAASSGTSLRYGPILAALSHAVCNKRGAASPCGLW